MRNYLIIEDRSEGDTPVYYGEKLLEDELTSLDGSPQVNEHRPDLRLSRRGFVTIARRSW